MYFAIVNLGLKSIRTIIFNEKGEIISQSNMLIKTFISNNYVEQDSNEWWNGFIRTFKQATEDINIKKEVRYISFTASAACIVPVDKQGLSLYRAIMVSDRRAFLQSKKVKRAESYKEITKYGLTSSSSMLLEKSLWIWDNLKDIRNKIAFFLTPNDFFIFRATGIPVTDSYNAGKFYAKNLKYPVDIYEELGLKIENFPSILPPGTLIGKVKSTVLDEMGLSGQLEVVLTTYDAISSFIGSGPTSLNIACDVSGTVTSIRMLSKQSLNNNCFVSPFFDTDYFIHGSSNNLSGGLLEWLRQTFYQLSKEPYGDIEIDATKSRIGASGLIFLPYLLGERSPIWDDQVRGIFFGLERFHSRKDFSRAVLESCAFITRDIIETFHAKPNILKLSGGLTRIKTISQIKANVCNVETHVLSEFETTAFGAFIIAYSSVYKKDILETIKRFALSPSEIIYPDPQKVEKYNKIFLFYKDLYLVNKPLFKRRTEILQGIMKIRSEMKLENL